MPDDRTSLFTAFILLLAVVSMAGFDVQCHPVHAIGCFLHLTDCGQMLEYRRGVELLAVAVYSPVILSILVNIAMCFMTTLRILVKRIKHIVTRLFG